MKKSSPDPRDQYQKITGFKAVKNGRLTAQYVIWLEIIAKDYFHNQNQAKADSPLSEQSKSNE